MKQYTFLLIICLILPASLSAQNAPLRMTLQECLDYALENNIQVKKSMINLLSGEEDTKQAKARMFPSLSATMSESFVNYASGETLNNNSFSGNFSVNANWTLFDGGRRTTAIKQQEIQDEINELNVEQNANDIRISLVQTYMQVLYSIEAVRINENTVEVSRTQRDRAEELFKAGSISRVDLAQMESQYNTDKYQLVVQQKNLDNYKLQLKQLLEFDIMDEIDPVMPELLEEMVLSPLPDKELIYTTSIAVMPEIKSAELQGDMAELEIKRAKGAFLPTLSLNAGVGTGHLSGSDYNFGDQIWNKFNESVGVTLSIPLFTNRDNKTALNKAKFSSTLYSLELLNAQKGILRTVEGIYLDASSAQTQYASAKERLKYVEESYKLTEEQFFLGMKNTLELLTEKNNLLNSQQELLQSKYMTIMSMQLLNIYQQKPVDIGS